MGPLCRTDRDWPTQKIPNSKGNFTDILHKFTEQDVKKLNTGGLIDGAIKSPGWYGLSQYAQNPVSATYKLSYIWVNPQPQISPIGKPDGNELALTGKVTVVDTRRRLLDRFIRE